MQPTIRFVEIILILKVFLYIKSSEAFSALARLRQSLETEKQVIYSLEEYLSSEEERLSQLRQIKEQFSQIHAIANKDVHSFLVNPINGYLLVKRLTSDWDKIKVLLTKNESDSVIKLQEKYIFPSSEDLIGSTKAILILQKIYKLESNNLANGIISTKAIINSETYNEKHKSENGLSLNADDCFLIGKQAYNDGNYFEANFWLNESINRLDKTNLKQTDYRAIVLDYLAFATYKIGNIERALHLTRELLKLSPNDSRIQNNFKELYKQEIVRTSNQQRSDSIEAKNSTSSDESEEEMYESLCRGENRLSDKTKSKLFCFNLDTSKIPYLRYNKIKVEEAFKMPQIVVFHDILTDSEIEILKLLSEPNLITSKVNDYEAGGLVISNRRVSKQTFLDDSEHKLIEKISTRIGLITGLDISTSEALQVVNYGIGEYYEPHRDYFDPHVMETFKDSGIGNRIATWLNYLNDVEAGGATVFPLLGITIWPKKGSAAFWYNLHKSGDGDRLTLHAGCPIIMGSKWICTKWFHEIDNEFRKPCSTMKNELNIIQKI